MIQHRSLVNYLKWVNEGLFNDRVENVPLITHLSFDASLKQVMSRLRLAFDIGLPLRVLFEYPTIRGLAERLDTVLWAGERYQASVSGRAEEREEMKL